MLFATLALMIHVDIDMAAPRTRAMMARVAAEVTRIWKPHTDLTFVDGSDTNTSTSAEDVHLLIVDRMRAGQRLEDICLGWIEFRGAEPASTITVSAQAAYRLADHARLAGSSLSELPRRIRDEFVMHALSRGIAHEIGHYLLRSPAHADRGLMRARFSPDELAENTDAQSRLQPAEIAVLRSHPGPSAPTGSSSQPEGVSTRNTCGSHQDDCLAQQAFAP